MCVRLVAIQTFAITEGFRVSLQLHVRLDADDGLICCGLQMNATLSCTALAQ